MRRAVITGTLVTAMALVSSQSLAAGPRGEATTVAGLVRVVRCPTEFGVPGGAPRTPASVTVYSSSSTRGLVAYTNTQLYLIGPKGLRCSGIVAADGGSGVTAWPRGHASPRQHSRTDGLTLSLEPACAFCRAEEACPFFPVLARRLTFPCTQGIPYGERVDRLRSNLALFEDPPGVAGSGWPSGGPDPANGLVGYTPDADEEVYRATCTLPASEHALCTTSLNEVIRRYG